MDRLYLNGGNKCHIVQAVSYGYRTYCGLVIIEKEGDSFIRLYADEEPEVYCLNCKKFSEKKRG